MQGLGQSATDEQLTSYRSQIDAKGWKHVAQVDGGIVFEVADDAQDVGVSAISDGATVGVPSDYPRAK